ncbi:MAG: hypothetical protein WC220_11870 [Pedobacter sp.]|jgi:Spy/CpxP family protein refolding chaperone
MKKLMIIATLFVGLVNAGFAQDTQERKRAEGHRPEHQMKTVEERAKMSADALEKRLGLSQEQKDKIYALHLERAEKMDKIQKSEMEHRKEQMEKRKEIMEETEKKMSKILNNEQQKKLDEMKADMKEGMKARPGAMHKRRMN